jgi:DNA primase
MLFSAEWLAELRSRILLSDLIGHDVKLRKVGRDHKGLCPFHADSRPSFTVSDTKGFFHCFSCPAHGDVIDWMMEYQGYSFVDAVKYLAALIQMPLPVRDTQAQVRFEKKQALYEIMAAASRWFVEQLDICAGQLARSSCRARNIA